ncbi:MAG: hypothetical protein M5U01_41060 [Ardenticatenaceae bacterium]|nr:hypothetical protein [Ardenticatenaceae bacterium]
MGAADTTTPSRPSPNRPETLEVPAQDLSVGADLSAAEPFGRLLWLEADRRGVTQANAVVVIGDGADWIWRLAAEHFPAATQMVDWDHARQCLWNAAYAISGQTELAPHWAKPARDARWHARLTPVLATLDTPRSKAEPVQQALTDFTTNQPRMPSDQYRARGLPIGSGSIQSGGKHVIAQRLNLAGMRCPLRGSPCPEGYPLPRGVRPGEPCPVGHPVASTGTLGQPPQGLRPGTAPQGEAR